MSEATIAADVLETSAAERVLFYRRLVMATLVGSTVLALGAGMAAVLGHDGFSVLDGLLFAAFLTTLPWLALGLWNSVIGMILNLMPNRTRVMPLVADPAMPITAKTALTMAIRNEDAADAIGRLRAMMDALEAAGVGDRFDAHVLSDTNQPDVAAREDAVIAAWRAEAAHPERIHYRRRTDNRGFKAGNIEEFCDRCHGDYDFFLPLDADSYMSAAAVVKLVRIAQANGEIGILQTLVVGMPSRALFTRAFQFGMRHGMRSFTTGSAWWSGDCGPYWGHNALIRMRPFHAHCRMPVLEGTGPLAGPILSHDQVEAVMMRRAGYHVRVIAEEGESWEENPPTLPDFIRRELRWCQGNMQYFWLLGTKGLKPVSRAQLMIAIGMYLGPPAWMAFVALSTLGILVPSEPVVPAEFPAALGFGLFVAIMTMAFAPKVMGLAGVLVSNRQSAAYGGRGRVLVSALVETVFSVLMAPVVAFAIAVFVVGLVFGKKIDWRAQARDARGVTWREAVTSFWPQTLFGLVLTGILVVMMPNVLPFAAPLLLGLTLAIPFSVLSAMPSLGRAATRADLCAIPEDTTASAALNWLHTAPSARRVHAVAAAARNDVALDAAA